MLEFFLKIYNKLNNLNGKFYSSIRFIIRTLANLLLPIYYLITSKSEKNRLSKRSQEGGRLIVSLTSFPLRINNLWIVIETILRQSKKPDLIILWLSREQFKDINSLPYSLLRMQRRGLSIELVGEDFRSHKKYYYVLRRFSNDFIITIDDDLFYSKFLIESLWNKHLQNPGSVVCNYGHEIVYKNGSIDNYKNWKFAVEFPAKSSNIFFGSGGGTLFPPNSFYKDVLNSELFLRLCPNADDVWLNAMIKLNKTNVTKINLYSTIFPIQFLFNINLSTNNILDGQNDEQIYMVQQYYKSKLKTDPFNFD